MNDLSDLEIYRLLNELRAEYGSLRVAHVAMIMRAEGVTSINGVAKLAGCSRNAVRAAQQRIGANVSEKDS